MLYWGEMQIDIHIPRPGMLLLIAVSCVTTYLWMGGNVAGVGGSGDAQAQVVQSAEEDLKRLRLEQQVMDRREDILRAEMDLLEEEMRFSRDPELLLMLQDHRRHLIALIEDQKAAEEAIRIALSEIREAQGFAQSVSRGSGDGKTPRFVWPVTPELGISAHFKDEGYKRRFGMDHHAIDIPADQSSVVVAAAEGTVVKVSDNGMGFNSIILRHGGGYATLYGHVSEFLVSEGQQVHAGEAIALSGGMPGTKGAGHMTTGAHLHLEMFKDGAHVDPMQLLPQSEY